MQYEGREESSNVEDRRGMRPGMMIGGGLGTLLLVVVIALLGGDPKQFLNQLPQQQPGAQGERGNGGPPRPEDDEYAETKKLVGVVLKDTEDVWNDLFPKQLRKPYREPKLVLFSQNVQSGCGMASAAMGPFYCPADQKVYLDLKFFDELRDRFKADGDFAIAYVVAHEVGHHVQNQLGISDQVHAERSRRSEAEYNKLSVRLELQADFLAGVWARHAENSKSILEQGDLEEAIRAAQAVGDDRIQKQARGHAVPESFTHGTSAQRARWFKKGFDSGKLNLMEQLFELDYDEL